MPAKTDEIVFKALDSFKIELPSWGFANTGTRFGKFVQAAAATSTEEKFSDAGQVHKFTGCCPTVAVHVLWDFPEGTRSIGEVKAAAEKHGVRIGAINPNVFQDQIYKHGSLGNPDPAVRQAALEHILDCVEIGKATGSRDISLWFADGSNYPGTANIRHRKQWFAEGLQGGPRRSLPPNQRMLVEYKPFEPAFYHTDIADWGMSLLLSRARRAAGQGAGRHRPPLPGAEHRADRGLAAERRHARRLPLQRPPLRRRRPHDGLDRSLPGLPHLPRDRALRVGDGQARRTSPTWWTRATT